LNKSLNASGYVVADSTVKLLELFSRFGLVRDGPPPR
jgi:hypothetical protein